MVIASAMLLSGLRGKVEGNTNGFLPAPWWTNVRRSCRSGFRRLRSLSGTSWSRFIFILARHRPPRSPPSRSPISSHGHVDDLAWCGSLVRMRNSSASGGGRVDGALEILDEGGHVARQASAAWLPRSPIFFGSGSIWSSQPFQRAGFGLSGSMWPATWADRPDPPRRPLRREAVSGVSLQIGDKHREHRLGVELVDRGSSELARSVWSARPRPIARYVSDFANPPSRARRCRRRPPCRRSGRPRPEPSARSPWRRSFSAIGSILSAMDLFAKRSMLGRAPRSSESSG